LQLATALHVRLQAPPAQFCWTFDEPVPVPVHWPPAQFSVQFAPVRHCRVHGPPAQLSVHVDPSWQVALHVALELHWKVQLPPSGHVQS
jgi:hypothetical protein